VSHSLDYDMRRVRSQFMGMNFVLVIAIIMQLPT